MPRCYHLPTLELAYTARQRLGGYITMNKRSRPPLLVALLPTLALARDARQSGEDESQLPATAYRGADHAILAGGDAASWRGMNQY